MKIENIKEIYKNSPPYQGGKRGTSSGISAFTLVELIIVITILAILATIGFMSYQTYTRDARDGKRKTDLGEVRKGLEMYQLKNQILPTPDEKIVTIYSGASLVVSNQGYLGTNAQKQIRMTNDIKDSKDKEYYTYATNGNNTKYELMSYLENNPVTLNEINNPINQTYAITDYTTRYPYAIGNYAVFFSGTTNTPLQESLQTNTGTIDLSTKTTEKYNVIIAGTAIRISTGSNLPSIIETETQSKATAGARVVTPSFTGLCTSSGQIYYTDSSGNKLAFVTNAGIETWESGKSATDFTCAGNIVVCGGNAAGYVLQACNLGLSDTLNFSSWKTNETTSNKNDSFYGNRYQFGKIDNSWTTGNSSYSYDWKAPGGTDAGSANDWGITDSIKTTATWYNSNSTNQLKMKGPCPTNYHVPTNKEWNVIYTSWGGRANAGTNLSNVLKLPFSGYRDRSGGSMINQGGSAYYWSSSPSTVTGLSLYFFATSILPNTGNNRAYWFSVRCFKDY
ncbi:MAG: FISUMP domain-containing protein [Candidatus Gracilibacteria bacterium]|nr:FISUMP domain-containing protein [Candidatus Gracilibacteria bacterium]